ncbi:MAG: TetR family transcriptional regulator C-terminal domain-containing protein [Actinophytocola sp.]|uniref:TetR/AcrR family transcriptional regulator n=1 Tax=Actinophytocola sp. TaxID=1872138 RepID=UPI003C70F690
MPKKVDHRSRRATIAESVWRVSAYGGIEAVTMRHVAAAAGMSLGQVQHYFTTKDELLAFAYDLLTDRIAARVSQREDPPGADEPEPRDIVREALAELLPLDEERTVEAHFLLMFLARSAVSAEFAASLRKEHADLHAFIVDQLRRGQRRGMVAVHLDPARETRTLLAVLDGLITHVLVGHHCAPDAEQALDDHLDRLFSG